MSITHKQHYVQRAYLSKWEENNQLWIYDQVDRKIKNKGKNAICFEIDYYKLDRLSEDEKRLFEVLYKNLPYGLRKNIYEFNNILNCEIEIEAQSKKIKEFVTKIFNDNQCEIENKVFAQAGESIICDIEHGLSVEIWDKLFNSDSTFMDNEQDRVDFYTYIIGQVWRVPVKKKLLANSLNQIKCKTNANISVDRMFPYFIYHQTIIESILISQYNKHKLFYLHIAGDSKFEFITSDNPVINTCNDFDCNGTPKEYEFYWPITPRLAVLISEHQKEFCNPVSDDIIEKYNYLIYKNSNRYVISHKQEMILKYSSSK